MAVKRTEPPWYGIYGMVGFGAGSLLVAVIFWSVMSHDLGYLLVGFGLSLLFLVGVAWAVKEGVMRADELRKPYSVSRVLMKGWKDETFYGHGGVGSGAGGDGLGADDSTGNTHGTHEDP